MFTGEEMRTGRGIAGEVAAVKARVCADLVTVGTGSPDREGVPPMQQLVTPSSPAATSS